MFASESRSEAPGSLQADALAGVRARGRVSVEAIFREEGSHRADVHESGSLRVRFPREHLHRLDATLVNVAGGMTGGDHFEMAFVARAGASLFVSSVAAEKIYRTRGDAAKVSVRLEVEEGAQCVWLPQETIIFNNARLQRSLEVDLAEGARLLACEMTVIGRAAMAETVDALSWRERWRIRRQGRLIFADDVRIEGDAARHLARKAVGAGAHCFATLLIVGEGDIEARLRGANEGCERACEAGVSSFAGLTVVRLAAEQGSALRAAIGRCIETLDNMRLPRCWHT